MATGTVPASRRPALAHSHVGSNGSAIAEAAPAIYSAPFVAALAYIFVDYGRPQSWIPALGVLRPGVLALGSGMLALVFTQTFPRDRLTKYMLAFLALMIVLVPFAENKNRAFYTTWSFLLLVFGGLMPLAAFVDSFEKLQRLLRFWVLIHVSLALYVLKNGGSGVGSFLVDENDVALAMNAALPYGVALLVLERQLLWRGFALVATLLMLVASTTTLSRGGFVGLTAVGLIIWLQSRRKFLSLVGICVFSGLVFMATPDRYWHDVGTIATADQKGDTGFQRIYSWQIGWKVFLQYPIFGIGPNNYPYVAWKYETEVSDQIGYHLYGRAAHSLYFTLLPEFGVVGTLIFAGMVFHGVRERRRLRRRAREVLARPGISAALGERARWLSQVTVGIDASLVGFLACGSFLSVLYYPHIWVLTAFTAALLKVGEASLTEAAADAPQLSATGRLTGAPQAPVALQGPRAQPRPAFRRLGPTPRDTRRG